MFDLFFFELQHDSFHFILTFSLDAQLYHLIPIQGGRCESDLPAADSGPHNAEVNVKIWVIKYVLLSL